MYWTLHYYRVYKYLILLFKIHFILIILTCNYLFFFCHFLSLGSYKTFYIFVTLIIIFFSLERVLFLIFWYFFFNKKLIKYHQKIVHVKDNIYWTKNCKTSVGNWEKIILPTSDYRRYSLTNNNTWEWKPLPTSRKKCNLFKIYFKVKTNSDGEITPYNVRLVAQGFT